MKQEQHVRHYKHGKQTIVNRGLMKKKALKKRLHVPSEICECGGKATYLRMDHGVPILKCRKCGDAFEAVPKEEYKKQLVKLRPKNPVWHRGYTIYYDVKSVDELLQLQKNGGIDNIVSESFKLCPRSVSFGTKNAIVVPGGVLVREDFDGSTWKHIPNFIRLFGYDTRERLQDEN